MDREQFVRQYSQKSGVEIGTLLHHMAPLRCGCGQEGCIGWMMAYRGSIDHLVSLGNVTRQEADEGIRWADRYVSWSGANSTADQPANPVR